MARRSSTAITDFLSDITDDIKDFLDDEILDRGRDTERDVRRAGRNWTDDDEGDRRGGSSGRQRDRDGRADDLADLRDAITELAEKVKTLAARRTTGAGSPGTRGTWVSDTATRSPAPSPAGSTKTDAAVAVDDLAISNYDDLTVAEINSRLGGLSQSELAKIGTYERKNANRSTVIDRVESLTGDEPWAGYDEQTVAEVRKALPGTDEAGLRAVRDYERRHKARQGVLDAVDTGLNA